MRRLLAALALALALVSGAAPTAGAALYEDIVFDPGLKGGGFVEPSSLDPTGLKGGG